MNIYFDLFWTFSKVGAMMFGGGYAMLPMLQREISEKRGWVSEEELADYYAIGQCTPGIIAVNTATFVGKKRGGGIGGVAATLGLVFPSLVLISLFAGVISAFAGNPWIQHGFGGIRICTCVLIFNATAKLYKAAVADRYTRGIFLLVIAGSILTDVSPVWFVLLSALLGIVRKRFNRARRCD